MDHTMSVLPCRDGMSSVMELDSAEGEFGELLG